MLEKVSTLNLTSQRVSTCKKVEEKGLKFGREVMAALQPIYYARSSFHCWCVFKGCILVPILMGIGSACSAN
jgi:hypothetical protein